MMTAISFVLILLSFVAIGLASGRKATGKRKDYYLASSSVAPWLAGLSAVATNNSGYMFIGVIGFTYQSGLAAIWLMIGWIVGDFIGSNGKPTPMSPRDQAKMLEEAEKTEDDTRLDVQFKKGDKIKVTNGAFQNFEGEVEEIIPDKGMVRIITTIFGRPTPLELEYWQIEKM